MSEIQDITNVRLGEDFSLSWSLTDPATGLPVPVTGWTGSLTLWDFLGNQIATTSMVIDNADGGVFHFTIPGASTSLFTWQFHRYLATVTQADGTINDLQRGTVYWEPKVP